MLRKPRGKWIFTSSYGLNLRFEYPSPQGKSISIGPGVAQHKQAVLSEAEVGENFSKENLTGSKMEIHRPLYSSLSCTLKATATLFGKCSLPLNIST